MFHLGHVCKTLHLNIFKTLSMQSFPKYKFLCSAWRIINKVRKVSGNVGTLVSRSIILAI